ncbi:MAG: hypothetical protein NUV34_02935 [Sulfuricaulis sp.]|nr:hypothetical protein [Sulfuricaulis sp.]
MGIACLDKGIQAVCDHEGCAKTEHVDRMAGGWEDQRKELIKRGWQQDPMLFWMCPKHRRDVA